MIKQPHYLKKGDSIAIVCPAKKLAKPIDAEIKILESWGLNVVLGENIYAQHHHFAGTDEMRVADMQKFLDDTQIKAIVAARGGYGSVRIVDDLDFSIFNENPKWIVGFSDITVLLSHTFAYLNTQAIHSQMPCTFERSSKEGLESLRKSLFGEPLTYDVVSEFENRSGNTEGILIGGNLTLLTNLAGSKSEMNFENKILFIEDVSEHDYAIDRMMRTLHRSGKLSQLKGLIVGTFADVLENDIPFGQNVEEIIWTLVKDYNYPVCFNFPVGHIADNRAMTIGRMTKLTVDKQNVSLKFL